jgi:hypothetical protein
MRFQHHRPLLAIALATTVAAGCAASSSSASPTSSPGAAIAPSTAPSASLTPPGPSPSATPALPTPTPLPPVPLTARAKAALAKYVTASTAPNRSFHASLSGASTVDGVDAGVYTQELDVNGRDLSSTATVAGTTVRLVAVGDKMWVKSGDGDWVEAPRNDQALADVLDVFGYVGDPTALVYIGSTQEGGRPVEHFRSGGPIPYQTGAMRTAGIFGSITDLGLTIEADGTPLRLTYRSTGDVPNTAGVVQHIESINLLQVSRWGEAIKITPPV